MGNYVICSLEKSKITYVFWKSNFRGYTDNIFDCGFFQLKDIIEKHSFPIVTDKFGLSEAERQCINNIVISEENLEEIFGMPKLAYLRMPGYVD